MSPRMRMVIGTNERRLGLVLAIVFLIVQLNLLFLRHYDTMDLEIYPNTVPTPDFRSDMPVGQTFRAGMNGLNRVDVMMGTHARTLKQDIVFRLREWLAPANQQAALRSAMVQGGVIRDNLYQTFNFPPIADSRGKTYAFEVLASGPGSDTPGCLWMNEADIYPDGSLLLNGQPGSGDCAFRTYSSRTLASQAGRISGRWPGLMGKPVVFWLAAVFFVFSVAGLLFYLPGLFAKRPPEADQP